MTAPFTVRKIGHAVIYVSDMARSRRFYTDVLGFKVSDDYPPTMAPGGMLFLRCNGDHHCLALVGQRPDGEAPDRSLHHLAAVAGPAARYRSSSSIPTAITSNSTGASTRSAPTAACALPMNGARRRAWRMRSSTRHPARTRP
jgi:catechol 2,3-dioxygenase-like lactoylglutathione lyase family enzyme